eukprot:2919304-Pleurochrysis_carterae.AAC.1
MDHLGHRAKLCEAARARLLPCLHRCSCLTQFAVSDALPIASRLWAIESYERARTSIGKGGDCAYLA